MRSLLSEEERRGGKKNIMKLCCIQLKMYSVQIFNTQMCVEIQLVHVNIGPNNVRFVIFVVTGQVT